jgi:hypothetical protein
VFNERFSRAYKTLMALVRTVARAEEIIKKMPQRIWPLSRKKTYIDSMYSSFATNTSLMYDRYWPRVQDDFDAWASRPPEWKPVLERGVNDVKGALSVVEKQIPQVRPHVEQLEKVLDAVHATALPGYTSEDGFVKTFQRSLATEVERVAGFVASLHDEDSERRSPITETLKEQEARNERLCTDAWEGLKKSVHPMWEQMRKATVAAHVVTDEAAEVQTRVRGYINKLEVLGAKSTPEFEKWKDSLGPMLKALRKDLATAGASKYVEQRKEVEQEMEDATNRIETGWKDLDESEQTEEKSLEKVAKMKATSPLEAVYQILNLQLQSVLQTMKQAKFLRKLGIKRVKKLQEAGEGSLIGFTENINTRVANLLKKLEKHKIAATKGQDAMIHETELLAKKQLLRGEEAELTVTKAATQGVSAAEAHADRTAESIQRKLAQEVEQVKQGRNDLEQSAKVELKRISYEGKKVWKGERKLAKAERGLDSQWRMHREQ